MMKTLRVMPGKNEDRFMEILHNCAKYERPVCRLGVFLGTPYNEYDISMKDYEEHKAAFDEICMKLVEAYQFNLDNALCLVGFGLLLIGLGMKIRR